MTIIFIEFFWGDSVGSANAEQIAILQCLKHAIDLMNFDRKMGSPII